MTVEKESVAGRALFCSWSGGKDSCLALYRAIQGGGAPDALLTILTEDGVRSRSHALPKSLIETQARSLGLRAVFRSATWDEYEAAFAAALREFKSSGIEAGVFGDIDVEPHREWGRRMCREAGITPVHPLWAQDRRRLLDEFVSLGFEARIVAVDGRKLDKSFLGKAIRAETIAEIEAAGADPSGELGEYHTVVTNGPIFSSEVKVEAIGEERHDGYWFLNLAP
jgi:diphthine-ammonia ligase